MLKSFLATALIATSSVVANPSSGPMDEIPVKRVRRVEQRAVRYLAGNRDRQTLYDRMRSRRSSQRSYDISPYYPIRNKNRRGYQPNSDRYRHYDADQEDSLSPNHHQDTGENELPQYYDDRRPRRNA